MIDSDPGAPPPLLPQNDPEPGARARALDEQRVTYQFDRSIGGLPLAHEVPRGQGYSIPYMAKAAGVELSLTDARMKAKNDPRLQAERDAYAEKVQAADLAQGRGGFFGSLRRRFDETRERGLFAGPMAYADDLDDFDAVLANLPTPLAQSCIDDDAFFAWQRVGGCNPLYLKAFEGDPAFPVTQAHFVAAMAAQGVSGDTLAAARDEGRLFWLDYRGLDAIPTQPSFGFERYLSGPMALFVRTPDGPLAPVAIQCRPTPGPSNPIVVPAPKSQTGKRLAWRHAKLVVQSADAALQGLSEHLGMCHVFANAVLLCTGRQLAPCHPVRILLWPHFEMTLAANETMKTSVIGEDGFVDQLQGPTLEAGIQMSLDAQRGRSVVDSLFHRDLALRGLDDAERLPDNPWRDAVSPIHEAIRAWVHEVLALYYSDPSVLAGDFELQRWHASLGAKDAGDLHGLPPIDTLDGLVDLVSGVIFRITAYHNIINYAGYDFYGWMPNLPTARFGPIPDLSDPDQLTEASLLQCLPPIGLAEHTLDLMLPQRELRLNQLGQYPENWFADERVAPILRTFQQQLTTIEHAAEAADAKRRWSYPWLRPSRIAQSIHV